ncbi:MAG TPA: hypothetical protein VJB97_02395 [Candidatus Paceibacterota bacterium]
MTFLLWSIVPFIGSAAAFAAGATWAAVPAFFAGLCPFLVFLASFVNPKAYWRLSTGDYICGALSVLAILLWYITAEPLTALVLALFADALATLPTLIKAWKYPETESSFGFFSSAFSGLMGVLAAKSWAFAEVAFPIYLFVSMSAVAIGAMRK